MEHRELTGCCDLVDDAVVSGSAHERDAVKISVCCLHRLRERSFAVGAGEAMKNLVNAGFSYFVKRSTVVSTAELAYSVEVSVGRLEGRAAIVSVCIR